MSLRFAVVYEHEKDFETATGLADRQMCETVDWLEAYLENQRLWIATNYQNQPLTWSGIKRSARRVDIRAHGHFGDGPGRADAISARRALEYLLLEFDGELDAVLFIRDQDDQPERMEGLEQARREHERSRTRPVILIGFAIPEREAWIISGFVPQDEAEQSRLDAEQETVGFNPCERSHELTAGKNDTATRSPKRVLRQLSRGDAGREGHCWNLTPLDRLRERGKHNGLAAFLEEVRTRLTPLIGHVPVKRKAEA